MATLLPLINTVSADVKVPLATLLTPPLSPASPIESQKPLTPFAKFEAIPLTDSADYQLDFPSLSRSITLTLILPNIPSTISQLEQRPPTPSEAYDLFANISPRALKILSHANPNLFLSSMHFPLQPSREKDVAEVCVGWLCVVDDVVEDLKTVQEVETLVNALKEVVIDALSGDLCSTESYTASWLHNSHALTAVRTTHLVCSIVTSKHSIQKRFQTPLLQSLLDILIEFREERNLDPTDLHAWLNIHATTMGFSTFFVLLRSLLSYDEEMEEVETMVRVAAGLQNDLFGLEKDIRQGNPLNAAIVLAKKTGADVADCVDEVARLHNSLVERIESSNQNHKGETYPALMAATVGGHARWAGMIKRYAKEAVTGF